jgi:hypothetical protein
LQGHSPRENPTPLLMVVMHVLAYSYITTEQNELKASKYSTTNRYHHIYAIFSEFSKHLLIKTMMIVVFVVIKLSQVLD